MSAQVNQSKPEAIPRRALIAVTGATAPLGKEGDSTGLFISEALHPYNALRAAGFEVDLSSETGSYYPDALSLTEGFLNGEDLKTYEDTNSEFRKKLDNMPKASELNPSDYGLFYASAGHAALIDYPTATNLQRVATEVWSKGGVVASVCHGPAIFANIFDEATGELLIKGKRIAGFTTEGEDVLGVSGQLKTWNKEVVEELAERVGAKYERSEGPWDDFHVVDGRLVTGQNPASATSTAKAAIDVFESL
ncbi:class I glutamine amidotransferase-like protein [Sarocladium strictum]